MSDTTSVRVKSVLIDLQILDYSHNYKARLMVNGLKIHIEVSPCVCVTVEMCKDGASLATQCMQRNFLCRLLIPDP